MSLFTVVQRILDKAGTGFIEPRREDGHGSSLAAPTFVTTGLTQPTTPADTQPVSGTVTANLGTLNGAATAANQATGNASLSSVDGKLPDLSGTWGYDSGVSGSVTIGTGKRVLQITAAAGASGATLTINGGSSVTIPAFASITIEPRGNLTEPALVFTGTTAYFVEHVN